MTWLGRVLDRCAALSLLAVIHAYWLLVSERRRRTCLFRISCSRFVHAAVSDAGGRAGLRALIRRWRSCRPGAHAELHADGWHLRLADGTLAGEAELADAALAPYRAALAGALTQRPISLPAVDAT